MKEEDEEEMLDKYEEEESLESVQEEKIAFKKEKHQYQQKET